MRTQAASLALLLRLLGLLGLLGFLGLPSAAGAAASLTHDWARIYNPAGSETILGMWPAPGGGVDMAVDNAGQLVYIQYNAAGTLTATRATGVGISTMPFSVLESDGAGGFILAANQDSLGVTYGLVVLRVSATGVVTWRRLNESTIYYPKALQIRTGRIYLGVDGDFFSTYDPMLFVYDLANGTKLIENIDRGYYFRISDIDVVDDGRVYLTGFDNDECECFTWIRGYDANGATLKTNPLPGHSMARLEPLSEQRNVILTTARALPLPAASFAVTWLHSVWDIPTASVDSRDFLAGGSRADILEPAGDHLLIAGEHDAGGGAAELLLGSAGEFGGVDVDLVRPDASKSYDALGLALTGQFIVMHAKQSNVGGSGPSRTVVLFDDNRVLQDYDVEGNVQNPFGMVIGNDGGIYAVGSGPLSGVILTKLLINLATGIAPQEVKAPAVGRLGMPVPNPSSSSVRLDYEVTGTAPTTMEIYDPAGRMVARLVDGTPAAGQHVAEWDARAVAKGVYFVRFKSGGAYGTRKLVIE